MEMLGMLLRSLPMMLVFLRLILRPNSLHACVKQLMSCYSSSCVCSQGSSICKQQLPNQYSSQLVLCLEVCEAEEASIASGVEVYAIFWLTEGIRKQQGEEDAKECWEKYTPLFHSVPNWEGVWGRAIILDSTLHAFMKRCNHPQELRETSNHLQ